VVPETPASPAELLAEARRRMLAGDYEGARVVLDEAAQRGDASVARDIAYLRAFTYELDGDYDRALAGYDALLAESPSDDVVFRRAETLGRAGRFDEALAALAPLGDPDDRPAADAAKIRLLESSWLVESGDPKHGIPAVRRALADTPTGAVPEYQARARVVLMGQMVRAAGELAFAGSDHKKAKILQKRALLVKSAQDELVAVIPLQHPASTIAALDLASRAYDELGAALLGETPPRKLTPDQAAMNHALLAQKVSNVWIKAKDLADKAVDYATQVGWHDATVDALAARSKEIEQRIEQLPPPPPPVP
jgi:tetratricopeptide (TPR) repeat protein